MREFEKLASYLLPNEEIMHHFEINRGYAVFSNRRFVLLKINNSDRMMIKRAIPIDCLHEIAIQKKDKAVLTAHPVDERGVLSNAVVSTMLELPKKKSSDNSFRIIVDQINTVLCNIREFLQRNYEYLGSRDLTYLTLEPNPLTFNAILDLNTVLQDKPLPDRLYHESEKYLGNDPFLLEESLKDGQTSKNGVLFAAGNKGYIWIQGQKKGRHIANVLVDKVEWENIHYLNFEWQNDDSKMSMNYTLQKGRSEKTVSYIWNPPYVKTIHSNEWLFQEMNGPWILADLMFKYSGILLPASICSDSKTETRVYY